MTREAPGGLKGKRGNGFLPLVKARELVAPVASGEALGASGMDLLMWVGYQAYPTTEAFSHEAQTIGISKRVSRIPPNLVPGVTRLWIVHDSGSTGHGQIVGYGTITGVDVLGTMPEDAPDYARSVTRGEAWREPTRGGQLRRKGIYLIVEDFQTIRPREARGMSRFRSYKWVARRRMEMLPLADREALPDPIEPAHRWSPEEVEALIKRAQEIGPYQASKEHARTTERSLEAGMYQWKQYLKRKKRQDQ